MKIYRMGVLKRENLELPPAGIWALCSDDLAGGTLHIYYNKLNDLCQSRNDTVRRFNDWGTLYTMIRNGGAAIEEGI